MTLSDVLRASRGLETRWTFVCSIEQLEPLWGEAALVGGEQVALFRFPDGRVFATSNQAPEIGSMVMSRGLVGEKSVAGMVRPTIASPLHKDIYDLQTGQCFTTPSLRLPVWRVRVVGGEVWVAPTPACLAVSHGTSDTAGRAAVAALVAAVGQAAPGLQLSSAFADVQQPDVSSALAAVPGDAVILPLLLSAGYHVRADLGGAAQQRNQAGFGTAVAGTLGPDPRLATVLARRLHEAGWTRKDRVILGAAGSTDAAAVADCHSSAAMLADELGQSVSVGFISAAGPRLPDTIAAARSAAPGVRVAVASYLLAPGYFQSCAASSGADYVTAPLLSADAGVPELVDIVLDRFAAAID